MTWQDTPLIDSTPRDVDEELMQILARLYIEKLPPTAIEEAAIEIKKLFKADGGS